MKSPVVATVAMALAFLLGLLSGRYLSDIERTTRIGPSAALVTNELSKRLADLEGQVAALSPAPRDARRSAESRAAERVAINMDGAPAKGPRDARVTIVEFADFQCPYCANVESALSKLHAEYPEEVRIVFKHLPIPMHPLAETAARAAVAAGMQGKFWEMHGLLFERQQDLKEQSFARFAEVLRLDLDRFAADLESEHVRQIVRRDIAEARGLSISGTPTFFINGKRAVGDIPIEDFRLMVESELKTDAAHRLGGPAISQTPVASQ